jgi:hypothetical protein
MDMIICRICKYEIGINDFIKNKNMCKKCHASINRKAYWRNVEKERNRAKKYYLKNKELIYEKRKIREKGCSYKHKIREKTKHMVKKEKIKKEPCTLCGSIKNIEAHHYNYLKPTNIYWLCRTHHHYIHRLLRIKTGSTE